MKYICPDCGKQYESGMFCQECGTKLQETAPELVCPFCGYKSTTGKFCPECGSKLKEHNSILTLNGHEYVDLGLSVKWATMNIGATRPEEYGDYFAWGETKPKSDYSLSTYKYGNSIKNINKYCTDRFYGYRFFKDNKTILDPEDDAAHVNWGGDWRMPTKEEQDELCENCTWTWTTLNGVNGYKVQSKKIGYTDKWIFLPAAGYRGDSGLCDVGNYGDYWSSSLYTGNPDYAYDLYFASGEVDWGYDYRYRGQSVRPVCL